MPAYDWLAKFVFTAVTLGTGFKGGEVTPLFFIGSTLGNALSRVLPLPSSLLAGMGFVAVFDRAFAEVQDIVDMPDRRASLLVRLCMQNSGRLSAAKRGLFTELTDGEITTIEAAVQAVMRTEGRKNMGT